MKKFKWGKKILAAAIALSMLVPGNGLSAKAAEDATQTDASAQLMTENDDFHLNWLFCYRNTSLYLVSS